jgi:hypothetical protein
MTPGEAVKWTEDVLLSYYQLGEYKNPEKVSGDKHAN